MSRQLLAEIIEARMEEVYTLVHRELVRSGFDEFLTAGVVLTGGTVQLEGAAELGEQIFQLPVRVGTPTHIGGLVDIVSSPAYSTGVGLVLYGARDGERASLRHSGQNILSRVRSRMADWFATHF